VHVYLPSDVLEAADQLKAAIHHGSCAELGEVGHRLADFVEGPWRLARSDTRVSADLPALASGRFSVAVSAGGGEPVLCGKIPGASPGAAGGPPKRDP
jgi:hypothetical protein